MNAAEKLEAGMELVCGYKDNKTLRDSFNHLSSLAFGINFEEWYKMGFWDERYVCHSIVYSNEIIANASISRMDLVINGATLRGIQIGTVMTHPDYRGKGLSRFLMNHILKLYELECDIFFLFANSTVLDFYPKFNFSSVLESQFSLDFTSLANESTYLRKLDITSQVDMDLIVNLVKTRKSISQEFGVENNLGVFMFYVLNMLGECIYYAEPENAIVLYEQIDETLHLYDVVSQDNKRLDTLLAKLGDKQTKAVHFHFTPTLLTDEARNKTLDLGEDQLFIRTSHEWVKTAFRAPKTAHA